MDKVVESYFVDIIKNVLGLTDQNVWIASQDIKIPKDDGFYIIISNYNTKIVAANPYFDTDTNKNVIQSTQREDIQIDLFSKGNTARDQRANIVMALNSYYSQSIQEKENFRIFKVPTSFLNTTELEGGSMLNRFTIRVSCYTWNRLEVDYPYYDTFSEETIYD